MPHRFLFPPEPLCDPVRANARLNRAMLFLGAACLTVGVRFFLSPDQLDKTSVGRALEGLWDETWSALYIAGGLLIIAGIFLRHPRLELPGLTLCVTATFVNGAAIVAVLGWGRALAQLPLYVLALWVFDGRIRDLLELPRDRRHNHRDQRPDRTERRVASVAPFAVLAAASPSFSALLPAVIGGGIVTALVQALLYRPQRRDLESRAFKTDVDVVREALGVARSELREAWDEMKAMRAREDTLEAELESCHIEIRELRARLDRAGT